MKYGAVLFDLDGTLLDSSEGVLASVLYTIEQLKYPPLEHEQLLSFIGPPVRKRIKEVYNLTEDQAVVAMNVFRENYGGDNLLKATVYDGLPDLLTHLRELGVKIGVATYKREDMAKRVLEHCNIAQYFDAICGSDAEAKLTKADVVQNCLDALGHTQSSSAIMIGDSDNDAIGAASIGLSFIGVSYGFGFKDKSDIASYDHIGAADTVDELHQILISKL